ncbi:sugar transporter [Pandoraea terrae]|uniref:Sugar transporter n=1 Tax=Pandoraea terrae TaxID=1537710 RepID=A0A5E4URK1_9BURK|nr:polysaccharide biosynthesis/export family protein [Pandoraea terrae]VVE02608.1 sugar transporter [Pandoraea terrae]
MTRYRWPGAAFCGPEVLAGRALKSRRGNVRHLAGLLLALALAGCAIAPGVHYPGTSGSEGSAAGAAGEAPPPGALTEITFDLVQAQRASRVREIPDDVKALFGEPSAYVIGPGDVLQIVVWDHPELTLPAISVTTVGTDYYGANPIAPGYSVDSQGMLQFAYVGNVSVAGLTELQARDRLTRQLANYLKNPQLTLRVQAYRSRRVYMDGEVRNPGIQVFNDLPMTLPEALNRAGGFTTVGDRAMVAVIRNGVSTVVNIPALVAKGVSPSRVLLRNDDIVRVFAREDSKIFVLGEVTRPSTLFLRNGELTLNEALGDAGGVSQTTGNSKQVYVVRTLEGGKPEIYHLDASAPAAIALAENFQLKAKDVVFVDAAPLVRWNRVVSLLLPSTQTAYFGKVVTN